ncbi:MAG TPA: hypothetical protein VNU19_07105 [Candidatus Acidoferrum sp.]|nr:hypothetical protein [Candidatus Acidoferrum sp.]
MADPTGSIQQDTPTGQPYRLPGVVTPLPPPAPENTFTAGHADVPDEPGVKQGGGAEHPAQTDTADEAMKRVMGPESGGRPYVGVGGADLHDAPIDGNGAPIWAGHGNSHAFGLFQFEPGTWARYAGPLGIKDWRDPGAQEAVFRAAFRNEGYAPWAPYDKALASSIGWREAPTSTTIGDLQTHARSNGFEWSDIHQQIADARQQATTAGASEDDINTHLGYQGTEGLKQRIADELAVQPQGSSVSDLSNGMVSDPKESAFGAYAAPTTAAGPLTQDTALQYAKAVNAGEVQSPQQFAQVYTDELWEAAGLTELAQEHKATAAANIAAQLPQMDGAVDGAIYSLRDQGLPVTHENAADTRTNLVNLWSRTGTPPAVAAQLNDPLMLEALTRHGGIRTPDQHEPPPPKLTFGEAMRETGEQLLDAAKGAIKGIVQTAKIPGELLNTTGGVNTADLEAQARDFAMTFGSGVAPEGTLSQGIGRGLLQRAAGTDAHPAVVPQTTIPATLPGGLVRGEASKLDQAINKIVQRSKATKIQLGQAIDKVDPKFRKEAFQKKVYASIEQRLVDHAHQHAPDVQDYLRSVKPLTDLESRLSKKVATQLSANHPDVSRVFALTDVNGGYVHRIRIGKEAPNSLQLQLQAGEEKVNPATGARNAVSDFASSMQDRVAAVWEDSSGHRITAPHASTDMPFGTKGTISGVTWTLRPATSAEITAMSGRAVGAAGRTIKFHENHLANTVENIQRLERVSDNLDLMDQNITDLETHGLFYREGAGKAGQFQKAPQGFAKVDLPGVKGWASPKIAHVLNDFYNHSMGDLEAFAAKANHFLISSLFMFPVVHPLNVLNNFVVSRGWKWLNPVGFGTMMIDGARAAKEVMTLGPRYIQHIREGNGMMFPNMLPDVQNFHDTMIAKFVSDQKTAPRIWRNYVEALRDTSTKFSPVQAMKDFTAAQLQASHSMTWMLNDILMLTREFEHERMGRTVSEAIQKTEQDIVAYRLPSSINRVIHGLFNSPLVSMFGRYDYGQARGLALMVKQAVMGSKLTSRAEAIGKLTVLLGVGVFGYGALNNWLEKTTGNPNASFSSFGYQKFVHAGFEVAEGRWAAAIGTVLHLSPFINILEELQSGLDKWGQPLINTAGTWRDTAISIAEKMGNSLPLGADGISALQHSNNTDQFLEQFIGSQVGLRLGPGQSAGQKLYWKGRDQKTARRQLQKDKIIQGEHSIEGWLTQHGK